MREFIKKVYRENKRGIRRYILSVLAISIMMWSSGFQLFAADMVGDFGENALARNLAGVCAPALSMGVEPFTCLTLLGIFVRLNDWFSWGFNTSSYIMGNDVIFIIVLCMCVLSKLAKSFGETKVIGMVTLDQIEEAAGPILLVFLTIATISGGFSTNEIAVQAASTQELVNSGVKAVSGAFMVLYGFIALLLAGVVYFVIRTVFFSLDVLTMALGFIPGFSALYEALKTLFITALTALSIFCPEVAFFVNLIVFFISLIFFRKAYMAIRFFKAVYVRPFFRRLRGYDPNQELIYKKIPKKIKKLFADRNIKLCIPVYSAKKYTRSTKPGRYSKWWLVVDGAGEGMEAELIRNHGSKKKRQRMFLKNTDEQKVFYHETLPYIEIFTVRSGMENIGKSFKFIKKDFHYIISKEYHYRVQDIGKMTGYVDFLGVKQEAKQQENERKQKIREEKQRKKLILQRKKTE